MFIQKSVNLLLVDLLVNTSLDGVCRDVGALRLGVDVADGPAVVRGICTHLLTSSHSVHSSTGVEDDDSENCTLATAVL